MEAIASVTTGILMGIGGLLLLFYGGHIIAKRLPSPWGDRLLPWVYVGPAIAALAVYLVGPTINTVMLSFMDGRSRSFVKLDNYIYAFTNPDMLIAFRNNALWLLLVTGLSVGLGLILAVLLDKVKYEVWLKSLIFLPMAISFVGASVIWRFVYAYQPANLEQIGLINAIIVGLGFEPIGWLVEKSVNNFALIAIMIWLQTGFCMVLLSSAVKGVPSEIIEAARMDGANEFQIFWRVIIPLIRSTLLVVATTVVILVLKVFDIVFVMTGGNQDTDVVASRMIKEMFNFRHYGRGSAIAVILLLAVIPVMVSNIRRFRANASR